MTHVNTIKKIGRKQAFTGITVGLLIAYGIMASLAGIFWLFQVDYAAPILFAAIMIYVAGYFIGGLTSMLISKQRQYAVLFGIMAGFLIVWTATFLGSLITFISEGLQDKNEIGEAIHDYIYKPMILVTMFGLLPIILVGIWFGLSIRKKLNTS